MRLIVGKFPVDVMDVIEIEMPVRSRPLHFDFQSGILCLWAVIDTHEKTTETRRFRMAGTGHELAFDVMNPRFMNTVLLQGGSLVFHFFELCP